MLEQFFRVSLQFGSKLYRNYKVATYENRAAKTVSAPVEMVCMLLRSEHTVISGKGRLLIVSAAYSVARALIQGVMVNI